jgi:hypothetical protein
VHALIRKPEAIVWEEKPTSAAPTVEDDGPGLTAH